MTEYEKLVFNASDAELRFMFLKETIVKTVDPVTNGRAQCVEAIIEAARKRDLPWMRKVASPRTKT